MLSSFRNIILSHCQERAFERQRHLLLALALRALGFPASDQRAFLCMATGKRVRALATGHMGAVRRFQCGVGMGDPASLLIL